MKKLTEDQKQVVHDVLDWFKKDKNFMQYVTIGGYAGTGKTTLIAVLRSQLFKLNNKIRIGFTAYTGKAARVLKNTLRDQNAIYPKDTVSTIHALIFSPVLDERENIIGWKRKEKIDCNLIIIDEASMVDSAIWNYLRSYNLPIIAVGDHGQLPPISGNFNLMEKTHLKLTKIHRQAESNPIIKLSIEARNKGYINPGKYSRTVRKWNLDDWDRNDELAELLANYHNDTFILCGYNKTRQRLNSHIRNMKGIESSEPVPGDRVICLRNNHKKAIFNGMLGTIIYINDNGFGCYKSVIQMDGDDGVYEGIISKEQFRNKDQLNYTSKRGESKELDLFDFGYALTVHKAQGSQARRVILLEERFPKMTDDDWKRWLYTGVTRAEEELYIF